MNLILLENEQQIDDNRYQLTSRQQEHLQKVVKAQEGDLLKVGLLNGLMGEGRYFSTTVSDKNSHVTGQIEIVHLCQTPPKALPLTLILALPRPNMLKRTLLNISAMGVKHIVILNSAKVEKSYWQSPVLAPDNIRSILIEGLEQARDTILPTIEMMPRFRPYVEDILPMQKQDKLCLLAHPYQAESCPVDIQQPTILAIGPEGGWNEFEVQKWQEQGFQSVHLGERILKVETAVPVLLSRLFPI